MPSHETKIQYAKTIISLFPKLRYKNTQEGYEAFYDPVTKKGWLNTRARNLFREKQNISISETTLVDTEPVEIVQDKINFLKFASPVQLEDIYNKTKETFKFRQNHRDKVAEIYPRFIDTDGLISLEFTLMYPNAEEFIATFSNYPPIIRVVYQKTVTNPNNSLLQSNPVDDSEEWDVTTRALIILIHLLPPTSSRKAKRESTACAIDKLITFRNMQSAH
ncbi:hypothetical protein QE152_g33992 [Popillia japonica]|uniref:Uncharacterized protein n=1 Tax=Popillia japonica TaxID=7064 RepID=A0AAW1IVA3_POPJA